MHTPIGPRCRTRLRAALFAALVVWAGLAIPGRLQAAGGYQLVAGWPQTPASLPMGMATWVGVDAKGMMYLFRRCHVKCADGAHPGPNDPPGDVQLFDASGKYLREWEPSSGGKWKEAHSLVIDRDGFVWTTD